MKKKWEVVLQKINIQFSPTTAGKKKIERKQKLYTVLKEKIGKDLEKIQTRSINQNLFVNVHYYLLKSEDVGSSKKDLDNLLKILFDVLSVNMVNGQKPINGLGIMRDDSAIEKIECEKTEVISPEKVGLSLMISKKA